MDYMDKLINTQVQMIILKEQQIALMKEHLKAMEEWVKNEPIALGLAVLYSETLKGEEKALESFKGTLNQYKTYKQRMSPEE